VLRYAFFGPTGTFSEAALRTVVADVPAVAMSSVDATIEAVRSGAADVGCVPIENSVEGGVPATLDGLAVGDPLVVVAEVVLAVSFVLAVKPGVRLQDVRRVSTHSHAHAPPFLFLPLCCARSPLTSTSLARPDPRPPRFSCLFSPGLPFPGGDDWASARLRRRRTHKEQIVHCFCVGTPKSSNLLWGGVISTVP